MMKSRLTIVEQVYFQQPGIQPVQETTQFSRQCESDEQVYTRVKKLSDVWVDLDSGWVDEASCVMVLNHGNRQHLVNPTSEELLQESDRVVEVAVRGPTVFGLVRVGESLRIEPHDVKNLVIRCRKDTTQVRIIVVPA